MRHLSWHIKLFPWCVFFAAGGAGWITACQDEDLTAQYLRVKMIGVFEEPDTAAGRDNSWGEPVSQTYKLENILMFTSSDAGVELHELYAGEDAADFRITTRNQRIFRTEIEDKMVDQVMSKFVVIFSNKVDGVSKFKDDHVISLAGLPSCQPSDDVTTTVSNLADSCVVELNEAFTIGVGLSYNFIVNVLWKKTVLRTDSGGTITETMDVPALSISVEGP